ncbi:hypothetical protein HGG75_22000 [Ochrobactrum pseudogrignonense]|nr:hypothetical protein [Brucella pseudogrignonensis]
MLGTLSFQNTINHRWLKALSASVALLAAMPAHAQTAPEKNAVKQSQNTEGESAEVIGLQTITLSAERAAKTCLMFQCPSA